MNLVPRFHYLFGQFVERKKSKKIVTTLSAHQPTQKTKDSHL